MNIMLDMDGVVADLLLRWLEIYNIKYNDNLKPSDITTYYFNAQVKKCSKAQLNKIIAKQGFFADLPIIDNSIEITKKLQTDGHKLFFVTATPLNSKTAFYDKIMWIDQHFPHIGAKSMISAHEKYMIAGDLLLDDSPKNLEEFKGISVCMNYNYNQNAKSDYRVNNWLDFYELITKINNK